MACLFRESLDERRGRAVFGYVFAAVAVGIVYAKSVGFEPSGLLPPSLGPVFGSLLWYGALAVALYACRNFLVPFTLAIGLITLDSQMLGPDAHVLARERTFFGIYEVSEDANGIIRRLMHGSTVHGAQAVQAEFGKLPMTYYNREGPVGQLIGSRATGRVTSR